MDPTKELKAILEAEAKHSENIQKALRYRLWNPHYGNPKSSSTQLQYEVIEGKFSGRIIPKTVEPQPLRLSISDDHMENIERMMDDIEEDSLEGVDQFLAVEDDDLSWECCNSAAPFVDGWFSAYFSST